MRYAAASLACLIALCPAHGAATLAVEGEAYARVGGPSKVRLLDRDAASGGKLVSYWEEQGVWLEWDFDLPQPGRYAISVRYACRWPDTRRRVTLDGKLPAKAWDAVRFETTGSWDQYSVCTLTDDAGRALCLDLAAGKHRLRMANVDSRGLAVDVIYLHDPGRRFSNVTLSPAEEKALRPLMCPQGQAEPVLTEDEMGLGRVRARFRSGSLASVCAAGTLWVAEPRGSVEPQKPVLKRAGGMLARLQKRGPQWELYVTDGRAFFMVLASPKPTVKSTGLCPRAYFAGKQCRSLVTYRGEEGQIYTAGAGTQPRAGLAWRMGNARLTASLPIAPAEAGQTGVLVFAEPIRAAALKLCPAEWSEAGLEVNVEADERKDTVHSSARDYPGLAAFYDYGRFRVEWHWGRQRLLACHLVDLATGNRVALWGVPK